MSVPVTRTLAYVLREQLARDPGLRLFVAPVTAVPDAAHVTVDQGGATVTITRLASYAAAVGDGAVCIAGRSSIIAIGAVAPTGLEV